MTSSSAPLENIRSSSLEKLLEHRFLSDLLTEGWIRRRPINVLRPDVDDDGFDVVVELDEVLRHVQLKGRRLGATTSTVGVHRRLSFKPNGCIVHMDYHFDNVKGLDVAYRILGQPAGCGRLVIPATAKKATRPGNAKKERPETFSVRVSSFTKMDDVAELFDFLFV